MLCQALSCMRAAVDMLMRVVEAYKLPRAPITATFHDTG